jgi:hypothetical protein
MCHYGGIRTFSRDLNRIRSTISLFRTEIFFDLSMVVDIEINVEKTKQARICIYIYIYIYIHTHSIYRKSPNYIRTKIKNHPLVSNVKAEGPNGICTVV